MKLQVQCLGMIVFYPANTYPNRKVKGEVRMVVEMELVVGPWISPPWYTTVLRFLRSQSHHTSYTSRSYTFYCLCSLLPATLPWGNPNAPSLSHLVVSAVTISHDKGSGNFSNTSDSGTTDHWAVQSLVWDFLWRCSFWVALFLSFLFNLVTLRARLPNRLVKRFWWGN